MMPLSSDAPNMIVVPNNPTAPAIAAALVCARLVRCFFLIFCTLQKRGHLSVCFLQVFVGKRNFLLCFLQKPIYLEIILARVSKTYVTCIGWNLPHGL